MQALEVTERGALHTSPVTRLQLIWEQMRRAGGQAGRVHSADVPDKELIHVLGRVPWEDESQRSEQHAI